MSCTVEEREFVSRHVDAFIKRHWKKLNQVLPEKDLETIVTESGNARLIEAVEIIDDLEDEISELQQKFERACSDFNEAYGDTLGSLVCNAETERSKLLQEKQEKFEYKVRTAIGFVELVSSERAYEVLESCRSQIEDLDKA